MAISSQPQLDRRSEAQNGNEPAIRAHGLSKCYGPTLALDTLDLTVQRGEVYGYLGPNGSGKTTTIRLLLGLHRPSAGRGELFGIDAWRDPVAAHRHVAYVAGEPFLWPSLTSEETFEFAREPARQHRPRLSQAARRALPARSKQAHQGALQGQPSEGPVDRRLCQPR